MKIIERLIKRLKLPKEQLVPLTKSKLHKQKTPLTLKELSHEYFNAGHL